MKRPLFPVVLLYAAGVLLGEWFHPGWNLLFGVGVALMVPALAWKNARPGFLAGLLIVAGWFNMERHTEIVSPNDLRAVFGAAPEDVKLRGAIRGDPAPRVFERGAKEFWRTSVPVEAAEVFRAGQWQPAAGTVLVVTPGILDSNFLDGQKVEVGGVIQPLRGALADGLFDPREFYKRQEVYFQLQADSTNDWQAAEPGGGALADRFDAWARRTLALGLPEEDEALHLMWTLALDWKAPLTETVEDPFLRAGTFHIFAVDGLRIGLLTAAGLGLLRAGRVPRAWAGAILIPVIWFYVGLTGWPASAARAAIMMTVVIGGWTLKRPGDLLNSLLAAALVVLLWNPQQLFQAGFQLSFLVVLCIALLALPMREFLITRLFPPDPLLPDALRQPWQHWLEKFRQWGIDLLVMSLAAFLASLPLTACYFHLFTPVGVPANVIVVPLTGLALVACMGSLLTGAWFPGAAILFNHAAWFLMKCIMTVSQWAAHWRAGNWYVSAPRPMTFLCYYAVLLAVFTGWIFRSRHKKPAWAVLLLLGAAWAVDWQWQRGAARLDVLALRGAPAVFTDEIGSGRNLLADCGDTVAADGIVRPFLHGQGVNRLDEFWLTTGYQQNMGGAEIILTNFSPETVLAGPARVRSAVYRRVTAELERTAGLVKTVQDGGAYAGWSVLYPAADDKFAAADEVSLALQREINGHSVLLLPALGRDGQRLLSERHPNLRAEIIVAGLPSRDEPLDDSLLEMLQPRLIVIADSDQPAPRRASIKLRDRLARQVGVKTFYASEAGSLTLWLRSSVWELRDAEWRNRASSDRP